MFISAGIAFVAAILSFSGVQEYLISRKKSDHQTLDRRIERLTSSLSIASKNIADIEREIEQRKQLALQLKSDADEAQRLKNLNADQVAAVAQALRGQLKEESRDSFWASAVTNAFFALLGAVFGEVFRFFRERGKQSAS